MEIIGSVLDKIIIIFAGVFIAFIYPNVLKNKVEKDETNSEELNKLKWMRPLGWLLMLIGIIMLIIQFV